VFKLFIYQIYTANIGVVNLVLAGTLDIIWTIAGVVISIRHLYKYKTPPLNVRNGVPSNIICSSFFKGLSGYFEIIFFTNS
jgi:hypothetical protein